MIMGLRVWSVAPSAWRCDGGQRKRVLAARLRWHRLVRVAVSVCVVCAALTLGSRNSRAQRPVPTPTPTPAPGSVTTAPAPAVPPPSTPAVAPPPPPTPERVILQLAGGIALFLLLVYPIMFASLYVTGPICNCSFEEGLAIGVWAAYALAMPLGISVVGYGGNKRGSWQLAFAASLSTTALVGD